MQLLGDRIRKHEGPRGAGAGAVCDNLDDVNKKYLKIMSAVAGVEVIDIWRKWLGVEIKYGKREFSFFNNILLKEIRDSIGEEHYMNVKGYFVLEWSE